MSIESASPFPARTDGEFERLYGVMLCLLAIGVFIHYFGREKIVMPILAWFAIHALNDLFRFLLSSFAVPFSLPKTRRILYDAAGAAFYILGAGVGLLICVGVYPLTSRPDRLVMLFLLMIVVLMYYVLRYSINEPILDSLHSIRRTHALGYMREKEAQIQYEIVHMAGGIRELSSERINRLVEADNAIRIVLAKAMRDGKNTNNCKGKFVFIPKPYAAQEKEKPGNCFPPWRRNTCASR
jgi:hypothetical protein